MVEGIKGAYGHSTKFRMYHAAFYDTKMPHYWVELIDPVVLHHSIAIGGKEKGGKVEAV
jgi:hypothetical protein